MSILEKEKLDAIGLDGDGNLNMLLIDGMSWNDKREHLCCLQDKINSYIEFIETKQYNQIYPDRDFSKFIIKISFLYKVPKKCIRFLRKVNMQLNIYNIFVEYEEDE